MIHVMVQVMIRLLRLKTIILVKIPLGDENYGTFYDTRDDNTTTTTTSTTTTTKCMIQLMMLLEVSKL